MTKKTRSKTYGKGRLITVFVVICIVWAILVVRLVQIQVIHGSEFGEIAGKQSTGKIKVRADRGMIFDRKGRQVAINVINSSLYAYPTSHSEIKRIGRYLDKLYGWNRGTARRKFSLRPHRFRWIDRQLSDDRARLVVNDSIPGLYIKEEMRRDYPFGRVGQQLLGFTDIDGRGISGLEYNFDSLLAGKPGLIDYLRDAHRNTFRIREIPLIKPTSGNSIVLTTDWHFQEIVEEELQTAVAEYNALEGSAIFVDCHTGEILAAADYLPGSDNRSVKLRAVSNTFEPGSVFKVFTAASLLDKRLVDTSEYIDCEEGLWKCGRRILRDDKEHDTLQFREIFELSSNIGFGKLALRMGHEGLVESAERFGFGQKTFVGLPGEQSGAIGNPGVWSDYNIAALSIGHSISVTPVQLACAVASVANGGLLMRPYLIRGVINDQGKIIEKNKPDVMARAMKEKTSELLRDYMIGVVERGTATPTKSDIVSIAGKTGTAEVVDPEGGGYIKNKFIASFMGFFPAEDPQIAGLVVLHQPEPVHYGGYTSGPTFRNIAERYCIANSQYLRPDARLVAGEGGLELNTVPNFVGRDMMLAKKIADKKGFKIISDREEGLVIWQYPPDGRKMPGTETIALGVRATEEDTPRMFDFEGMKLRTALAVLGYLGVEYEIVGCGKVQRQFPKAGENVSSRSKCRLVCGNG